MIGAIDEVFLHYRALTEREIRQLMQRSSLSGTQLPDPLIPRPPYWRGPKTAPWATRQFSIRQPKFCPAISKSS